MLKRQYHRANIIGGDILDEIMPYSYIIDNILVNKDLSTSLAWEIELPLFLTKDESARYLLSTQISSLFNSLPRNFDVQLIWVPQHNFDPIIAGIEEKEPAATMLKAYQREQVELIKTRAAAGMIRRYKAYIFLVRTNSLLPGEMTRRAKARDKKKGENPIANFFAEYINVFSATKSSFLYHEEWETMKLDLFGQANSFETALLQSGLRPSILTEDEVLNVLYYWWNPMSWEAGLRPRKYETGRLVPVTDYIIQSPLIWDPKTGYYEMDGGIHRLITLRVPPESIDMVQFENILSDPGFRNIAINCSMMPYPVEKRIAKLTNELPLVRARVQKEPRMLPTLQQLQAEIVSLAEGNEKVWMASHTIHIWAKTAEELDDCTREIKRKGLQAQGLQFVQEEHGLIEYQIASSPGWTRDKDKFRQHIYNTSQLVGMLPLVGQPEKFEVPLGVVLETSAGGLYNYQPHDAKNLNNFNSIIIGTSGTGKSFLASTIMAQLQRTDVRVLGIDLGGSYKGICESLGGTYVTMDIDMPNQRINPLYFPPGSPIDSSDIERCLLFLEKLIVDPGINQERLSKERISEMDEALRQLIAEAEGKEIFLKDFQELMIKGNFNKNTGKILQPWVGNGRYAKLFDGPSQIDFDNPFTIFDLSLVKDSRDIAPLTLMSIINGINAMAKRYPKQPKLMLIDEAWFMLKDKIAGKFVAECFRTFRKTGTGIVGISQGIEEWMQLGEEKDAILNNTSTYIILRQGSANAIASAANELHLNSQEAALIGQLATIPGEASQALLRQTRADGEYESVVIVNRPTPLLYAMSTTNSRDKSTINDIHHEIGGKFTDALVEFAKRYPKGTMNAAA